MYFSLFYALFTNIFIIYVWHLAVCYFLSKEVNNVRNTKTNMLNLSIYLSIYFSISLSLYLSLSIYLSIYLIFILFYVIYANVC